MQKDFDKMTAIKQSNYFASEKSKTFREAAREKSRELSRSGKNIATVERGRHGYHESKANT